MKKHIFNGVIEPDDTKRDEVIPVESHDCPVAEEEPDSLTTDSSEKFRAAVDVNRILEVSKELEDAQSLVGDSGYILRNRLIEEASDLTTTQKIEASYRNDNHAVEQRRRAAQIGNEIRDNKTKNGVIISLALVAVGLATPQGRALLRSAWYLVRKVA